MESGEQKKNKKSGKENRKGKEKDVSSDSKIDGCIRRLKADPLFFLEGGGGEAWDCDPRMYNAL